MTNKKLTQKDFDGYSIHLENGIYEVNEPIIIENNFTARSSYKNE